MISQEEFENLAVGDTVLTTTGDEGTVLGWNKEKTEVLLKFKGRPRFSTPWYRQYEIKNKIMPKVKFEDLDMERLKAKDIVLKNIKVAKNKSECDVVVNGVQVGERHVFSEELKADRMSDLIIADMIKKRDLILESREKMDEKLEDVEKKRSEEDKPTAAIGSPRHQEIEELAKSAKPMKFESIEEILEREGFVRGAVVSRINAFDEAKGYGILTGEFKKAGDQYLMEMTDGSSFNKEFLEPIEDVNKEVLRTIKAECGRILENAELFVTLIEQKLTDVIES
jgi:hypothetical protein